MSSPENPPVLSSPPEKGQKVYKFLKTHLSCSVVDALSGTGGQWELEGRGHSKKRARRETEVDQER